MHYYRKLSKKKIYSLSKTIKFFENLDGTHFKFFWTLATRISCTYLNWRYVCTVNCFEVSSQGFINKRNKGTLTTLHSFIRHDIKKSTLLQNLHAQAWYGRTPSSPTLPYSSLTSTSPPPTTPSTRRAPWRRRRGVGAGIVICVASRSKQPICKITGETT